MESVFEKSVRKEATIFDDVVDAVVRVFRFIARKFCGLVLDGNVRSRVRPIASILARPIGLPQPEIIVLLCAAEREQELRARQNARYAAVVDNAPDAILTIDADGAIQFANPAAARASMPTVRSSSAMKSGSRSCIGDTLTAMRPTRKPAARQRA